MSATRIDLNADVGESTAGADDALLKVVTSANVAAGFHAGDPSLLRHTVRLATANGVAVGAHPSFPDREGFGRREMEIAHGALEDLVLYQVAAVAGVAAAEGTRLRHVKPHGALYNLAARDRQLADAIARATAAFDRSLILFGPPGSALLEAGRAAGLRVAAEGFADRAYLADGSLAPRTMAGAVIEDEAVVAARVIRMVIERRVLTLDGGDLSLHVDTVCIHGDTPGAARLAAAVRGGLASAGVVVGAPE